MLDAGADLGEGPSWDPEIRRLIWVDIAAGVVHRFDPASGTDEPFEIGQPVERRSRRPTAGSRSPSDGFSILDPRSGRSSGSRRRVRRAGDDDERRQARTPAGRFWAGTKDAKGSRPIGSLYRLDPGRRPATVLTGVTVSNGPADSTERRCTTSTAPPIGSSTSTSISRAATLRTDAHSSSLPKDWGPPDGMTVDEDGFLWVAFWSGSAVRRFAPDGRIVSTVRLPVSQVTSCAFGGDDFSDLYVTTARTPHVVSVVGISHTPAALFRLHPVSKDSPSTLRDRMTKKQQQKQSQEKPPQNTSIRGCPPSCYRGGRRPGRERERVTRAGQQPQT